ncbi:hypothetical protein IFM89_011018 [Coptis chinensis]|uniref:C2H2-type domain-containing protein n=1 Tax=Coptis chinensis TaxID=261450 RepID=A0A835IP88_9MAGN|nr:hypothetical protein IFM89_011018 [Coptis chinensis]
MEEEVENSSGEASGSSSGNQLAKNSTNNTEAVKRKRNLPGMPDPEAEVISLSPKTLMATNRFICEICNKGFQRDQNLQLHRRGHNLPWKLRQRSNKEVVRKRVYVCPEPTCIHHDPKRALGDLTGIKKHFSRKHGEKKWKCDKCGKKYAVQSDWKAHGKTCGSKEYKCDCGTVFSRRDSFVTHRAFCDALADESSRKDGGGGKLQKLALVVCSSPNSSSVVSMAQPVENTGQTELPIYQKTELPKNPVGHFQLNPPLAGVNGSSGSSSTGTSMFNSVFGSALSGNLQPQPSSFSDLVCVASRESTSVTEPPLLRLSSNSGFTLFGTTGKDSSQFARPSQPAMSATALLQKAAEMGATASNPSLLRGFNMSVASSSGQQETLQWNAGHEVNTASASGHPTEGGVGLTELVTGPSLLFGSKLPTHDFLGLRMGLGGGGLPTGGVSALYSSMRGTAVGGRLDVVDGTASSIVEGNSEAKSD